jgi:2-dehydropantoate 2-reductase
LRIVVLGAGAFGSWLGGFLARGGENVTLVDTSAARVAEINARGVRMAGFRGELTAPVRACAPADLAGEPSPDAFFLCVKPAALETAVREALPAAGPSTIFVSFVGGLAPFRLPDVAGAGRSVAVVSNAETRLRPDGVVECAFHNFNWIGEYDLRFTERLDALQAALAWAAPSLVTRVVPGMIWSKAQYSLEVALSTLAPELPALIFKDRIARRAAAALVREAIQLSDKAGVEAIQYDYFDPNLYRAKNRGEGKVMEMWIHNAWMRHEGYRDGFEYEWPAKTGLSWSLSPENPDQETTDLIADLRGRGRALGVAVPLLERFAAVFEEARAGKRALSMDNVREIDRAREQLGIGIPWADEDPFR